MGQEILILNEIHFWPNPIPLKNKTIVFEINTYIPVERGMKRNMKNRIIRRGWKLKSLKEARLGKI